MTRTTLKMATFMLATAIRPTQDQPNSTSDNVRQWSDSPTVPTVRQFRQFRQFRYFPTVPTVSNSFKNVDLVDSPGLTRINVDVSTILQKCRECREPLTIAAGFV